MQFEDNHLSKVIIFNQECLVDIPKMDKRNSCKLYNLSKIKSRYKSIQEYSLNLPGLIHIFGDIRQKRIGISFLRRIK